MNHQYRNSALDFARAIAIIIIVTCHFLLFDGIEGLNFLGRALANIGNFVFFAISAILFGIKYSRDGRSGFSPLPFMRIRMVRLYVPLWIFLTILLLLYRTEGLKFSEKTIAMNYLGFGWFSPLYGNGHLWFVTMILLCYVMYVIVVNTHIINMAERWSVGGYALFAMCLTADFLAEVKGLPGYMFVILSYSLWFFCNYGKFISKVDNIPLSKIYVFFILGNVLAITACLFDNSFYSVILQRFAGYIGGLSWLILLLKYGKSVEISKPIMTLSMTSYEIYLVHHCMCSKSFSVLGLVSYPVVNYLVLWSFTIIFAELLKRMSNHMSAFLLRII